MPHRQLPNSTPTVIRLLKTARDEYKNTPNGADRAITADQWTQLDDANPASLLNRFLGDASAVDLAGAAQAPLTGALSQTAAKLTMAVSHFHQVLDMGVARGTFSAGARSYYGRDITATSIPDLSNYVAVAEAGEAVVNGEAARQTAEGAAFVPMSLPSAAEVGALLTQFATLGSQSEKVQLNTDNQRKTLNTDYPAVQALAVDICDTVEFFYRKTADDATRRVQCQRWGVVYIYDNAGTPTPTPPAPPTTPPAK
jgi:hypothetical protein